MNHKEEVSLTDSSWFDLLIRKIKACSLVMTNRSYMVITKNYVEGMVRTDDADEVLEQMDLFANNLKLMDRRYSREVLQDESR